MPYASGHLYLTALGDCYDAAETWQWGVRFETTSSILTADLEDLVAKCAPAVTAYWGALSSRRSNKYRLLGLKLALIDTDGRYLVGEGNPGVYEFPSPLVGGQGVFPAPQDAVAVTFDTGTTFGRAKTGRVYEAGLGPVDNLTNTGHMSIADAEAIRDAWADFLPAVSAAMYAGAPPNVENFPAVMSELGTGTTKPIVAVRVGRLVDTQRRRRNKLQELYTTDAPIIE